MSIPAPSSVLNGAWDHVLAKARRELARRALQQSQTEAAECSFCMSGTGDSGDCSSVAKYL